MKRTKFLRIWSVTVGSMDALTGLALILAPALVLEVLGIVAPSADALLFLSWIGVFVAAVGLSYSMALGRRSRAETVWGFTGMVRILVAVFLSAKILGGDMPAHWGIVAGCDGLVGVFQIVILRLGWWREVPK